MQASRVNVHVFRGLLWSPAWFFTHEGPYTKLAKVALVNLAVSKTLNAKLFGVGDCTWDATFVHGRSLIDTRWMAESTAPAAENDLASIIRHSSWLYAHGRGAMRVATDKYFRYCPACLEVGFQSSLMQIVGLDECPVHGLTLTNRCAHCGATCPRYAVCSDAFREPMRCTNCRRLYSEAWTSSGLVDRWRGIEDRTGFVQVERWLAQAGNLIAPGLRSPELQTLDDERQRRVVFDFLRQEVSLDIPIRRPVTVGRVDGLVALLPSLDERSELVARRVGIFKAVRRHFERVLGIRRLWRVERRLDDLFQDYLGPLFSIEGRTPSDLHGFLLWRARFEGNTELPSDRRQRRAYRRGELQHIFWPEDQKVISWNMASSAIDCNTWGIFVLYCLHKDLLSAGAWADALARARDLSGSGAYSFSLRKREILVQMSLQLQPDSRAPPAGIGMIASDGRAMLYNILTPDGEASGRVRDA